MFPNITYKSQNTAVSVVTNLQAGWPVNRGLTPDRHKHFFLSTLTFCESNPASCPKGTVGKMTKAWRGPLTSSAEVKNPWSYISTNPHVFMM
jgi:hypothetical protein